MNATTPIQKICQELKLAHQSQLSGNQGRARVCARRAAGWAIQEHLRQQGISLESSNALDHIKYFSTLAGHSPEIYTILQHLTLKMAKDSLDTDSYYPIEGVDLVSEARWLAEELLQVKLDLD